VTILQFSKPFEIAPRLSELSTMRRCQLAECHGACCLHGVWVDPLERDDILEHAASIAPYLADSRQNPAAWFTQDTEPEPAFPSRLVLAARVCDNANHYGGTECVFLRGDARCALQAAADATGLASWRYKPFHCIIHPLTFDDFGRITLAPDEELMDEPGSCFRRGSTSRPLDEALAPELDFLHSTLPYGKIPPS
jgi:hypothetical protein